MILTRAITCSFNVYCYKEEMREKEGRERLISQRASLSRNCSWGMTGGLRVAGWVELARRARVSLQRFTETGPRIGIRKCAAYACACVSVLGKHARGLVRFNGPEIPGQRILLFSAFRFFSFYLVDYFRGIVGSIEMVHSITLSSPSKFWYFLPIFLLPIKLHNNKSLSQR